MNRPDSSRLLAYQARVQDLVRSLQSRLALDELAEVEHLIEHGENGLGLEYLAQFICSKGEAVEEAVLSQIGELASGLVDPADMPEPVRPFLEGSAGAA